MPSAAFYHAYPGKPRVVLTNEAGSAGVVEARDGPDSNSRDPITRALLTFDDRAPSG
jgi:hypothetical protein